MPKAIGDKIVARDESSLVPLDLPKNSQTDEDDPYAGYEVPDDLTW